MSAQLSTFQKKHLEKLTKCQDPISQMTMVISFYDLISFKDGDPQDTEVYELIRTTLDYFIEKYGKTRVMSVFKKCHKTKQQQKFFKLMFEDE
jgi:hypothetical protein